MSAPRPVPGTPAPWSFPTATESTLDNGGRLISYALPGQHVISTRVVLPAPIQYEPRAREGVATLVSRTMDEGTQRHSGEEMAELLERNGIGLSASAGENGITLAVDAIARRFPQAMELLAECLAEPIFDAGEVQRHQRQRLADIEQTRAQAAGRAAIEWVGTRYAEAARASRPTGGAADTVRQITRDDLVAFHRSHVTLRGGQVVVAGDIDHEQVRQALAPTLGSWTASADQAPAGALLAERAPDAARVVWVDRPGSVQTEIHLGTAGPSRHVEGGWAPYPVLSHLIGGGPGARLDAVLREEKGYTYGMRATFRPRLGFGEFLVNGSVRADATGDAVRLLVELLDRAAQDGFAERETREAIDYVSMTAPGRYATADVVADLASRLAPDRLSTQFVTDYLHDVRALSPDALHEAWRRVAGDWTLVLVGDASAHAATVEHLGLGSVTVIR